MNGRVLLLNIWYNLTLNMNTIKKKIHTITNALNVIYRNYIRISSIIWKNDRKTFIINFLRNIFSSLYPIVNAFIYGEFINLVIIAITKKVNVTTDLIYLFIFWITIFFISNYLNTWTSILYQKAQLLISKIFTELYFEKLNSISVKGFSDQNFNDLFNKASDKYTYIPTNISNYVWNLNSALFIFIFSLIAFFVFSPLIVLLVLISIIPTFIFELNMSKRSFGIWDESIEFRDRYWGLTNIFRNDYYKEIKIHEVGNYLVNNIKKMKNDIYERELSLIKKRTRFNIWGSLIDTVVFIIAVLYIVYEALNKIIAPGFIATFFSIFYTYMRSVHNIIFNVVYMHENSLYLDEIYNFLEYRVDNDIMSGDFVLDSKKIPTIEFKNISFKYPNSTRYVFKNLSFIINPGDKIAIIGENGAGKTTLINLLSRFYDVNSGEILIDGINIKEINLSSLYKKLGILFQEYIKYGFSVKEGIQMGNLNKKATDEIIKKVARDSNIDKFIEKLDKGYDTILNMKSNSLSGGQWQSVAIAREFFRDADILIFDEPTSNLDPKAETKVFNTINRIAKDKTLIFVSHRFSTIRNADKIMVLDKGKVIEQGTHNELMKIDSKYKKLFLLQAKGYKH